MARAKNSDISKEYCDISAQRVYNAAKNKYIELESVRQWNEMQKATYGAWETLSERKKNRYSSQIEAEIGDDLEERIFMAFGITKKGS